MSTRVDALDSLRNPGGTCRRLAGKVALVTGGASGLGKGIAQRLTADGATVVVSDIQAEIGHLAASEIGGHFIVHDVCDETGWNTTVSEIEQRFGHLDILVNNAGILGAMDAISPENTTLASWRRIFAVNVEGVFLGCRSVIPAMRRAGRGGSIINISSVAGLLATPYATAYGASKATVRQLTKSVAQYCAQEKLNVRCNSVHPGNVRTPLWDRSAQEIAKLRGVTVEAVIAEGAAEAPLGDYMHVEDIAAACAFLASDDSRNVTGAKIVVDGGLKYCDTFHVVPKNYAGVSTHR